MNPPARTVYLNGGEHPIAVQVHETGSGTAPVAVILCPPFGWEEVSSYRSRREWARSLAAAGYPTARVTLPGTGNSGSGPRDTGRLRAWVDAVAETAVWLRAHGIGERVTAIGMQLGGLVAFMAAAGGAPIDDLALWATPSRGRGLTRQMKAFARMETATFFEGLDVPGPVEDGDLEAGGFLLTGETLGALDAVDLAALELPGASDRRVLLLEQDSISVDASLRASLERQGVAVSVAAGDGYAAMTAPPQQATPALETFGRVQAWLDARPRPAERDSAAASVGAGHWPTEPSDVAMITLDDGGKAIERELVIESGGARLVGTLTEPTGQCTTDLCLVFFNAGAIYRIGPNRMWVEAARRWAQRGVRSLRIDMEAIGDSDGDPAPYVADDGLYTPVFEREARAALDALTERGIGDRFLLAGLCSGAYWALHATLEDERAVAALLLNGVALNWDPQTDQAEEMIRLRTQRLTWRRVRRAMSPRRAFAFAVWILGSRRRGSASDDVITRIGRSGKRILFVFGEGEALRQNLELSGRMERLTALENVTVEFVAARDHTLRPGLAQREAHDAFDRAVQREIDACSVPIRA